MGNNNSFNNDSLSTSSNKKTNSEQSFATIMETIAEKYILTQNFEDMTKMNDPQYCEKIIILTSELLNENLDTHEIEFMAQKTRAGLEVFEKTKQTLTFVPKDKLNTLNNQLSGLKKKRMCMGIARFFVKIAQLYSSILMTLNPVYSYTDSYGNKKLISLKEKKTMPSSITFNKIYYNLCNERLDYLTKESSIPDEASNDKTMFVKPDFCSYGINSDGTQKKLTEQVGIKELEKLYYDVYDYETGKFSKMSDSMRQEYQKDLLVLYNTFTENNATTLPSAIKSFSDVKLKIYKNKESCKTPVNPFNIKHYGTLNDRLFKEYATHVKTMKQNIQNRQQQFTEVLKELFISVNNPENGKTTFSIHPLLTIEKLEVLNKKVIRLLVEQYVSCEKDYIKGLEIYESIVESKIKQLTESQIQNLQHQMREAVDKTSI